jgi:hypothetical protein
VARGARAPATALVLSGDVHHAYAAELVAPSGLTTRVHQLTVSPLHNEAPHPIQVGFRMGWSRWAERLTAGVARLGRVRRSELRWAKRAGPFIGNQLGELLVDGDRARFVLSVTERSPDGGARLRQVLDLPLTAA